MSWWIKDTIAQEVRDTYSYALIEIECDDFASLPSYDQTASLQIKIARGSKAEVLENSKTYKLNSSNVWVEQKSGLEISADDIVYDNTSSGMTATNVQDAIDEIKDLDDMQDRALTELYGMDANQQLEINYAINTGSKNVLKFNNDVGYTLTTHGRTFEVLADGGVKITGDNPDTSYADFYVSGTWGNREPILNATEDDNILSLKCSDPLQTENLYIRAVDRRTGSTANTATARLNQEAEFNFPITTVLITVRPDVVLPSGGITVYPMIRNKVIRNSTFEPYAPTNRELYEMILALQSGRSVQSVNPTSTLNLSRNELNEQLDTNFDLIDSIPEEEEGEIE